MEMTYFMCKTDYDHELGYAAGGVSLHPSVEDLKRCRPCVEQCGIVEVRVEYVATVAESSYD